MSGEIKAEHEVVIAGGGPTGMVLAAELTLAGVEVLIVERREDPVLESARGGGLQSRTLEVFDQRGIVERFLDAGEAVQVQSFAGTTLSISDFPTRHPYGLALWQNRIEQILAGWVVDELEVPVLRGRAMTGLAQDHEGVDVELSDGSSLRARYLVGCDGGRSRVRRAARIGFPGTEPTMSSLVAEVAMREEPVLGMGRDEKGVHAIGPLDQPGRLRVVIREIEIDQNGEPTQEDLSHLLVDVYGTDFGLHDVTWISRFTDAARQAECYRDQRVLLAGDAAHVHSPVGGQGLSTGIQDAVNLGWKLAQVVHGSSADRLLDSYHAERHPVGARVLHSTLAQTALMRSDARVDALRDTIAELVALDEPRKKLAGAVSGLDIHYDFGDGHPLLGRRMPDLDLSTSDGSQRTYTLLHEARPLLLNFGAPAFLDLSPWGPRLQVVDASYEGGWKLPVLGEVAAPGPCSSGPTATSAGSGTALTPGSPMRSPLGSERHHMNEAGVTRTSRDGWSASSGTGYPPGPRGAAAAGSTGLVISTTAGWGAVSTTRRKTSGRL